VSLWLLGSAVGCLLAVGRLAKGTARGAGAYCLYGLSQSTLELNHSKKGTSLSTYLPRLDASPPLSVRAVSACSDFKSTAAAGIAMVADAPTSRRGERRGSTVRKLCVHCHFSSEMLHDPLCHWLVCSSGVGHYSYLHEIEVNVSYLTLPRTLRHNVC